jgi:hypothetical protein
VVPLAIGVKDGPSRIVGTFLGRVTSFQDGCRELISKSFIEGESSMRLLEVVGLSALVLSLGIVSVGHSENVSVDRAGALSRLDSKANECRRFLVTGPRKGAVQRQQVSQGLREIDALRSQIESGRAVDAAAVTALVDRDFSGASSAGSADVELRREARDRDIVLGRKLGMSRLARTDEVEQGSVDRRVDQRQATVADQIENASVRRSTLSQSLTTGPKLGAMDRERIRQEIESLDMMIETLESQR